MDRTDRTRERYEKAVEGLSQAIFHLTWLGHFWGRRGVIVLDEIRSWYVIHKLKGEKAGTLSARSSTYYAAGGNAMARASRSFFTKPLWLMLAFLCSIRSLWLSDRLVKARGGIQNMTQDQLDIRSHIFRRFGWHREALKCVYEALHRESLAVNSRVLLLMGEAESYAKLSNSFRVLDRAAYRDFAERAYKNAMMLKEQVPVSTQVRLLRSLAGHLRARGDEKEARKLLEEAKGLATQNGLADQVKKIEAAS